MAYTNINKSSEHFNTVLYDGNATARNITTGFRPDWVWLKSRSNADHHQLFDVLRGAEERIYSSLNYAQGNNIQALTSFNSDSFSLGTDQYINGSGKTYASWNWKANGAGSANTDGSISSTVSANTTSGFSIVSYTGTASNATVGHGLGAVPKMIIVKNLISTGSSAEHWYVYHASLGNNKDLLLNLTNDATNTVTTWNNTTPTSSVFSIGSGDGVNKNGEANIAYCFAEKTGYSKFGSFEGNNNADGAFIYLGFKPSLIITKSVDTGGTNYDWLMFDNKRNTGNVNDDFLEANNSDAETTSGRNAVDFLSNGFKCRSSYGDLNSNQTYIYMAFAEAPLVGSNNVPCTAR